MGETASTWSACVGNVRQTALPCLASTTTAHGSQQHRGRCWGPHNRGPWPVLGVPKNQKNLQKDVPSWSHAERPIREGKSFRGLFWFSGSLRVQVQGYCLQCLSKKNLIFFSIFFPDVRCSRSDGAAKQRFFDRPVKTTVFDSIWFRV